MPNTDSPTPARASGARQSFAEALQRIAQRLQDAATYVEPFVAGLLLRDAAIARALAGHLGRLTEARNLQPDEKERIYHEVVAALQAGFDPASVGSGGSGSGEGQPAITATVPPKEGGGR